MGDKVYDLTINQNNSNNIFLKKCAFTLAETLIALTVLGIIAAITIPPLVKRNQQAQDRLRIKKGMTIYDMLMSKMLIENNIKSLNELKTWANKENCPDSSKYFKIVEVLNNSTPKIITSKKLSKIMLFFINIILPLHLSPCHLRR